MPILTYFSFKEPNTQLTNNEVLELKALIAPSDPELEKIEDLKEVKEYLQNLEVFSLTDDRENLKKIKGLNLTNRTDITTLPKSIGKLTLLTKLNLSGCFNLKTLPESIGNLKQLTVLDLCNCKNLTTLPENICNLTELTQLNLTGCENLTMLPENIGNLTKLVEFDFRWCKNLTTLPESIGNLNQVKELRLYNCENIIVLPESIGNLKQLTVLHLYNCKNLTTLPESIGKLTQLNYLILDNCKNLQTIPDNIGKLENLKLLLLDYCINIQFLPENIGNLRKLQTLSLRACEKLETLPESICELEKLTGLILIRCTNITKLPDNIKELTNLKGLYLNNCISITEIPEDILKLNNLEHLGLCNSDNIENILNKIDKLNNLKELKLWNCRKIEKLPDCLVNLEKLTQLDLSKCKNLTTLPENIGKLTNLQELNLVGCKNIQLPKSIDNLNLTEFDNKSLLSIAFIFYQNRKYKKAEDYFLKIEIKDNKPLPQDKKKIENKCYFYAQLFLALIYCKNKKWEKVQQCILEVKKLTNGNHIKEVMDRINSIDNNYKAFLLKILLCYLEIRELLSVNMMGVLHNAQLYYERTFAYYTNPDVAIKLLAKDENGNSQQNLFQMGSISQVNDPSEGKVIFDYFNGLDILKENNITLKPVSEFATFVGCFTFNHNKLNQFRLYGKEQGKEATGVSVVSDYHFFNLTKDQDEFSPNQNEEDKHDNKDNKLTLYRCIYLNPKGDLNGEPYIQVGCRDEVTFYLEKGRTNKHWQEYIEDIQDVQKNVKQKFMEIKNNIQSLFKKVYNKEEKEQLIETVGFMLMPLSFMIKHSAYQEEQECRIFQFFPFNDKKIKIEKKRMYVEYLPIDSYVEKIYLSPYAGQYADMFRALSNGKVEVKTSDEPFR